MTYYSETKNFAERSPIMTWESMYSRKDGRTITENLTNTIGKTLTRTYKKEACIYLHSQELK